MSFMQSLLKDIEKDISKNILNFLTIISDKYSLDKDELLQIWNDGSKGYPTSELSLSSTSSTSPKKIFSLLTGKKPEEEKKELKKEEKKGKASPKKEIDVEELKNDKDLDPRKLLNYNVSELKALCKRHGLKVSGKKEDLIKRLQGKEDDEEEVKEVKEVKKDVKKKSPTKKEKEVEDVKTLKKIETKVPTIDFRRNEFGHIMHTESKVVIDKETKEVYAHQNDDGTLSSLTPDDIEICKKYNLNYRLPENLDVNKKGFDDVKIKEMEEDEEKKVDEEVEYEEEEVEYEEYEEEEEIIE